VKKELPSVNVEDLQALERRRTLQASAVQAMPFLLVLTGHLEIQRPLRVMYLLQSSVEEVAPRRYVAHIPTAFYRSFILAVY
jgi:hypothetical protein